MKRYFEFIGGTSAKFYEVSTSGNQVSIRFGRLGTEGQTQVKTLADVDAAVQHANRMIAAKVAKGYREAAVC